MKRLCFPHDGENGQDEEREGLHLDTWAHWGKTMHPNAMPVLFGLVKGGQRTPTTILHEW